MLQRKSSLIVVALGFTLVTAAAPLATANHFGLNENFWFSYEVPSTMTPGIGLAGNQNDRFGVTNDGEINFGGSDVETDDWDGDGIVDFPTHSHRGVVVRVVDDVWGIGVRSDLCVDGNNDNTCVDQPERSDATQTDAQTKFCGGTGPLLDYSPQHKTAVNETHWTPDDLTTPNEDESGWHNHETGVYVDGRDNDGDGEPDEAHGSAGTIVLGEVVVFIAGQGNQGIIDENNPDPFICDPLAAPTGATMGGVLANQFYFGNGISFAFFDGVEDGDAVKAALT